MAAAKRAKPGDAPAPNGTTIARNRRARHDFEILERFQAGIALRGGEIKSIRAHRVQLQGAYARMRNRELWLEGMVIAPYENAGYVQLDTDRPRKLLLHRRELAKIREYLEEKGLTVVPLSLWISERGLAKVEVGVARGLKRYDKRQRIREREESRQVARAMRHAY